MQTGSNPGGARRQTVKEVDIMLNKGKKDVEIKAFLGEGTEFEGKLIFTGAVRLDGKFKGEILGKGTLVVGQGGRIEADIQVDSLMVGGDVRGTVEVRERMEIDSTGRLTGNIKTGVFIVHEGGLFEGNCQMAKGGATPKAE
ncbi:MAG: polymer-forming cytoskeletal protein [Syntrophales bacterium]|nr:polymer-forming cytoskeletal protein [Syntrophales bacterium]